MFHQEKDLDFKKKQYNIAMNYMRKISVASCLILLVVAFEFIPSCTGSPHSIFHQFETLRPNQIMVRKKRATAGSTSSVVTASFEAFQKRFEMLLTRGARVLHPHVKAELVDYTGAAKPFSFHSTKFYSGILKGQATHQVDASEAEGVWMIHIHAPDEFYAVEPMRFYDGNTKYSNMIVYKARDIKTQNETVKTPYCEDFVFEEPKVNPGNKQTRILNPVSVLTTMLKSKNKNKFRGSKFTTITENVLNFKMATTGKKKQHGHRTAKQTRQAWNKRSIDRKYDETAKDCDLVAVADYNLYKGIGSRSPASIVQTLVHIYSIVDKLYRATDFGGKFDGGYGLLLRGIIIHTNYTYSQTHYNSPNLKMSAKDVILALSRETKFFPYCLAHLTTQRDTGATIGLASRASPGEHWDNGICAGLNGFIARNVGTSTVIGPTKQIQPLRVYSQVVAHEIGHNWGAKHDPVNPSMWHCSPTTSKGGKFLMWAYSVLATDPNSFKFSPCSKKVIRAVLEARAHKCFLNKNSFTAICGNGLLERSEECDPGWDKDSDPCCQNNCGLRRGAQCSFRHSPCCTPNCTIAPPTQRCYPEGGLQQCYQASRCNGKDSKQCPEPTPLPNGSPCDQRGSCLFGRCMSFCERIGRESKPVRDLRSCECDTNATSMCTLCCMDKNVVGGTCKVMGGPLHDGSACLLGNCYNGVCLEKNEQKDQMLFLRSAKFEAKTPMINEAEAFTAITAPQFLLLSVITVISLFA